MLDWGFRAGPVAGADVMTIVVRGTNAIDLEGAARPAIARVHRRWEESRCKAGDGPFALDYFDDDGRCMDASGRVKKL